MIIKIFETKSGQKPVDDFKKKQDKIPRREIETAQARLIMLD